MARKHFDEYYNNIAQAYMEQNILLGKMLEGVEKGEIELDRVEMFKSNIQPIINNFSTISYIKFLLDMPNRNDKKKQDKYKRLNKKLLAQLDPALSTQELMKQNEEQLQKLKDLLE